MAEQLSKCTYLSSNLNMWLGVMSLIDNLNQNQISNQIYYIKRKMYKMCA